MNTLHRFGTPFVFLNALLMVLFGLGASLAPEALWELAGVKAETSDLTRLMGWYLLVFGVGGLMAARHPERHPVVVALIGVEKIGPAVLFPLLYAHGEANVFLALAGIGDGVLALVFIIYAWWLNSTHRIGALTNA